MKIKAAKIGGHNVCQRIGYASVNTNVSDNPGTVSWADDNFPGIIASWRTDPVVPDRITHTWVRFHNGPISGGGSVAFTFSDGTPLISGAPSALYVYRATVSLVTADTLTMRWVTADFDPTTLCWSNEPAYMSYPIAFQNSQPGLFGNDETGFYIPLPASPVYGIMAYQANTPGPATFASLQNSWGGSMGIILLGAS